MDQTIIGSNRRIDPTRRAHLKPDLTPDDNDRVEIGPTDLAFAEWKAFHSAKARSVGPISTRSLSSGVRSGFRCARRVGSIRRFEPMIVWSITCLTSWRFS